jgi:hypothetical protein
MIGVGAVDNVAVDGRKRLPRDRVHAVGQVTPEGNCQCSRIAREDVAVAAIDLFALGVQHRDPTEAPVDGFAEE